MKRVINDEEIFENDEAAGTKLEAMLIMSEVYSMTDCATYVYEDCIYSRGLEWHYCSSFCKQKGSKIECKNYRGLTC